MSKKRLIDKEEVRDLIAQAHLKQLYLLLERLEQGLIEAQEMRLIWDMVKAHNIGLDNVEDLVKDAMARAAGEIDTIELDDTWSLDGAK